MRHTSANSATLPAARIRRSLHGPKTRIRDILRVMKRALALALILSAATVGAQQANPSDGSSRTWDPAAAAAYLDARMDLWYANGTKLKTGDSQTACVSCHAGLAYALSRPVLRRVM